MARHQYDFDLLVQRSRKPRSRVGRGLLNANLEVIVRQVAANKEAVAELVEMLSHELDAFRGAKAEAKAKAEESAKRAAEREAAARKKALAEAAKAQADAAAEEAKAAQAEAKAAAAKAKRAPKKKK